GRDRALPGAGARWRWSLVDAMARSRRDGIAAGGARRGDTRRRLYDRALARFAMTRRESQHGLALIIAMLVAALAAAVAISVATAQAQWSAQVSHRRDHVQAQSIALA